uniref:Uncharacterized protein n=1 Tax=Lepeophtheirus salmonis TaxID=72036 RepID=A0A0K2USP4_LEPSM
MIDSASKAFFEAEKIPQFETVRSLLKDGNISLHSGFQVLQIKPKNRDILPFCEGENGLPVVERGIKYELQSFSPRFHCTYSSS